MQLIDNRSNRSEDINPYINSFMNTSEKTETTALMHHVQRFPKLIILAHNTKAMEKLKHKRKTKMANAKRYALQPNASLHLRNFTFVKNHTKKCFDASIS